MYNLFEGYSWPSFEDEDSNPSDISWDNVINLSEAKLLDFAACYLQEIT